MKHTLHLILTIIFIGLIFESQAQEPKRSHSSGVGRRYSLGFCMGSGADWILTKKDEFKNAGPVASLRYGIPIDINFTTATNYYFTTGLLFQHLGGKQQFTMTDTARALYDIENNVRSYRSIFITIPVGIKLKTPDFSNFVFAVNFGLQQSFAISSKATDKFKLEDGTKQTIKRNDFSKSTFIFREAAYIGVGLEYVIKDDFRVHLFVNYAYTFTNYFKKSTEWGEKGNLNSLELVLGCNF
ncbi:MAG: outer membrane beta-barrel protein [Bacteroidales bacterium]|nr:outer membrane beta-barrel protein [Bacteroidales bacterium]